MIKSMNNLIWIPMNIYVNIRNKRKLVEKIRRYANNITCTQAANISRLQK